MFKLLVVFISVLVPCSLGANVITHTEASYRALSFLSTSEYKNYVTLLRRNEPALQAGSIYPDTFYGHACQELLGLVPGGKQFEKTAKFIHSGEYVQKAIRMLHDDEKEVFKKDGIWTVDGEDVIAFVFGVASHTALDLVFHDLTDYSIITALNKANVGFESYDDAHYYADRAVDSIQSYEMDFPFIRTMTPWSVPVDHIDKLISHIFLSPGKIGTRVCMAVNYAQRFTDKLFSSAKYSVYANKSSLFADSYEDYPSGGASHAGWYVGEVFKAIAECLEDESKDFCGDSFHHGLCVHANPPRAPLVSPSNNIPEFQTIDDVLDHVAVTDNGKITLKKLPLSIGDAERHQLVELTEAEARDVDGEGVELEDDEKMDTTDYFNYYHKEAYAKFGSTMFAADFTADGFDELVVGAPGARGGVGAVYMFAGSQEGVRAIDTSAENEADAILTLDGALSLFAGPPKDFGHAVTHCDLNADGKPDIVVAGRMPYAHLPADMGPERKDGMVYNDFVAVYLGDGSTKRFADRADAPDYILQCNTDWVGLDTCAEVLVGGDVTADGFYDLVLASPWASDKGETHTGMVRVIPASKKTFPMQATTKLLHVDDVTTMTFKGANDGAEFGSSVVVNSRFFQRRAIAGGVSDECLLYIGAPGHERRVGRCHDVYVKVGAVFCYSPAITAFAAAAMRKERVALVAKDDQRWMSHNRVQRKAFFGVYMYGRQAGSRFGQQMALGDADGYSLAVAAPHYDVVATMVQAPVVKIEMRDAGTVSVYKQRNLTAVLKGDRLMGRFGSSMHFADIDNDGRDDLMVAAPWRARDITNLIYGAAKGSVYIYFGRNDFATWHAQRPCASGVPGTSGLFDLEPCPARQADSELSIRKAREQFGKTLAVVRSGIGIGTQVFVGAPRSDTYGRQSGHLVLFNNNCE